MNYSPGENFGPAEEAPPLPPEYLVRRPRRTRSHPALRRLVRETALSRDDLILPLFVVEGSSVYQEVSSMPGVYRESLDRLSETAKRAEQLGIPALILFGVPPREQKDPEGRIAWAPDGIVQRALEAVERAAPSLLRIVDLCFCEYTDHGHCGVLTPEGQLDNDATLPNLELQAISLADAGAQMLAPSGMLDGGVAAIRNALDEVGHAEASILAYAVKYASGFYGPFRDAADSAPAFGDRSTYQMDPANAEEALREVELDLAEGADSVMVKPGLPYLDIVRRVKETFQVPVFAYQVSGEYAMIEAAVAVGAGNRDAMVLETLLAFKRAGASGVLTYHAAHAARLLGA